MAEGEARERPRDRPKVIVRVTARVRVREGEGFEPYGTPTAAHLLWCVFGRHQHEGTRLVMQRERERERVPLAPDTTAVVPADGLRIGQIGGKGLLACNRRRHRLQP